MSDAIKVFAFVLMVVGFFVFHTWIRTQVLTTGYQLDRTQKSLRILDSQKFSLKVERSRQLSPESLEALVQKYRDRGTVFESPKSAQLHYLKVRTENEHVKKTN